MEAPFLFHLWDMEEKKIEEGEKEEFTVVTANLQATMDPALVVSLTSLTMNEDKNTRNFSEMMLKSQVKTRMGKLEDSPFMRVEHQQRWKKPHIHLDS